MLEASNVSVVRGRCVILRKIGLQLEPGRVTAVIGPNGAGKSTLLACLSGALTPTDGTVRLDGEPLHQLSAAELGRRRAVLEQTPAVAAGFAIGELVGFGIPRQVPPGQARAIVGKAITAVELMEKRHQPMEQLSGGEQQRAHLARVLAQLRAGQVLGSGHWLLLDEPTAHLDLAHQATLIHLVRQVASDGAGVVIVVHDLSLAAAVAGRVVLMERGQIVAYGPAQAVLRPAILESVYKIPFLCSEPTPGRTIIAPLFPPARTT